MALASPRTSRHPLDHLTLRLTSLWAQRYAAAGCPASGAVTTSFRDVGRLLGFDSMGGWQYRRTRSLLGDLGVAHIDGRWLRDDDAPDARFVITQGAVEADGKGETIEVHLSTRFQATIRSGAWTYVAIDDLRVLQQASCRSDTPLLLWLWLQTESLPWASGWIAVLTTLST
jgi:hypothetical protein